jgi:hypothetical protein
LAAKYGGDNWVNCKEEGKQEKEFCELTNVESWTENGWTPLYRVIRHMLAPHKKMIRIVTNRGIVDATDDHSLLTSNCEEISPKDCIENTTELLHYPFDDIISYRAPGRLSLHKLIMDETINEHEQHTIVRTDQLWTAVYMHILKYECEFRVSLDYDKHTKEYIITVNPDNSPTDNTKIRYMENIEYYGYVYDLTTENHHFAAGIGDMIVHNTDSVFFTFNLKDNKTGEKIRGKKALEVTIEIAQDAAKLCSKFLKPPMDLTYEKTLMPFILLSKKRYVGMLYEEDANKGKLKYMGLSLKRRDSCDYLKDVYGNILNILMKENNVQSAIQFLDTALENLIAGRVPMEKLEITKALRSDYKNPNQIAHKVLADRIGQRDPGNKPKPGDRMKFVFIVNSKGLLMGDRIETPEYIITNKLQIDYMYYITNQLMKPLQQLFGLALEQIWEHQGKTAAIKTFHKDMEKLEKETGDLEEFMKKKEKYCSKKIEALLFKKFLDKVFNEKNKIRTLDAFGFKK